MKRREHPMVVALVEAYARATGETADDCWAFLDRRRAPSRKWRDGVVAAFYPRVPPDSFLPCEEDNGTLRTMGATNIEPPRRGRPPEMDHALFEALAAKGVTLAEEAKAIGRSPASIRSFCYPKDTKSWRPAPEALRKRWLAEYGVPLKVWR